MDPTVSRGALPVLVPALLDEGFCGGELLTRSSARWVARWDEHFLDFFADKDYRALAAGDASRWEGRRGQSENLFEQVLEFLLLCSGEASKALAERVR